MICIVCYSVPSCLKLELNRDASRRGDELRQQRTRVVFEIIPVVDLFRRDSLRSRAIYLPMRASNCIYTLQTLGLHLFHLPFGVHQSLHSSYLSLNQNPRLPLYLLLSTISVRLDTFVNSPDTNYVGRARSPP